MGGDYLRKRGADLRNRANLTDDPDIKAQLVGLAVEYEELAVRADKLDRISDRNRKKD